MARKRIFKKRGSIHPAGKGRNRFKWILGGAAVLVAVGCGILFIPKLGGNTTPLPTSSYMDPGYSGGGEVADASHLQNEAVIRQSAINDPAMWGEAIVYSATGGSTLYNKLYLYHIGTKESEELQVKVKYNHLIWMEMNDDYIAYLDASPAGGGRICYYDRAAGEYYVIKEYAYALPQISLDGEYLVFLQQAGDETDRLYIYNLRTRESVAAKVFTRTPAISGSAHVSGGMVVYAVAYYEGDLVKSRVTTLSLATGEEENYEWGRYVYAPQITGSYIVFSSSSTGITDDIYISENGNTPMLLVEDTVNCHVGDGFIAYTKGDNVYVYMLEEAKTYQLNTQISKGTLASVNGRYVCWYDVTSKEDVDVVKYAEVTRDGLRGEEDGES